jgi:hypothetical protein
MGILKMFIPFIRIKPSNMKRREGKNKGSDYYMQSKRNSDQKGERVSI